MKVLPTLDRRTFVGSGLAATFLGRVPWAWGADPIKEEPFQPLTIPGKVVRVSKSNAMQPNGVFPKEEAAHAMLERALAEFTGKQDIGDALALFVHPEDKVAVKLNGIAGQRNAVMATNKELVLSLVRGLVRARVKPENIVLYEQYPSFLAGTRVADRYMVVDPAFPTGVRAAVHRNKTSSMQEIQVMGIGTRYASMFTDATAVINVSLIKDHSICGYTGCLKNITHGTILNPHDFHKNHASPQIPMLYAQSLVRSRMRLNIVDGFKVTYNGGPLDDGQRMLHESVYVGTDPVSLDVIGVTVIDNIRREKKLPNLDSLPRKPQYLEVAGDLGLGVFDKNQIALREVKLS